MSLPSGNRKEELQIAWFRAVVAQAGASFYVPNYDCGADYVLTTSHVNARGRVAPTTQQVFCQLKASQNCRVTDSTITYDFDAEGYNKLAELDDVLSILLLLHSPEYEDDWLEVRASAMCIRNCCYWWIVPNEATDNRSTIAVPIPLAQRFDEVAVRHLLEQSS